jgi:transcription elongation factor Elf1
MVCPHCQTRGSVTSEQIKAKKGISGGKATAAIMTVGLSVAATGLARKEKVTQLTCSNCGMRWQVQ